jgi:quinol monooxygenase YgiN
MIDDEPETTAWFAIRMGPPTFGIFDAFANARGREAHLQGKMAAQLMSKAPQLFEKTPEIHRVDMLADKLPH